ncbi:glycyl-radical enzyme activating protein [Paludibacterium yongneupense]|uniref:glycyl-radical enzyme activating protein n=1 Tax=Paludibacterium yongneupense TaxID=400061 RepID=UPI00040BF61C|nr:glycyl-radical enzyme activating protein [Paludibacterium yongneupense]
MLFNLQRYSTHDGPGIRTVVFFKGCTLACRWCQNPESRSPQRQVLYDARLCLSACTLCAERCPHAIARQEDGTLAIEHENLTEADYDILRGLCPSDALNVCGEAIDLDAIMEQVLRDRPYYERTGGGLTLSGGEPFLQAGNCAALLARAQAAGLHTAVESCLQVRWSNIEPSLPHLDLLLADLKHVDAKRFHAWTGGSVGHVLDNLRRLSRQRVAMTIRVPLIPDFNADADSIRSIVDFAADELGVKEIHFLPYHTLGVQKYAQLGMPYLASRQALDTPELLAYAESYASSRGLAAILRG